MTTEDAPRGSEATADLDLAVVLFRGGESAAKALYEAREHAGAEAQWTGNVALVEHYHGGRLALRGVFAGHFVDVDEADHLSQPGAAEGLVAGGLIGVLAGPPGFAAGLVLGAILGSQLAPPTETEREPKVLADGLRTAVPRSSSALVMIGAPASVDEMLAAVADGGGDVSRRKLTPDQIAKLNASLDELGAPTLEPPGTSVEVSREIPTPDQIARFKAELDEKGTGQVEPGE
jgi:uncharacterized membrane protein